MMYAYVVARCVGVLLLLAPLGVALAQAPLITGVVPLANAQAAARTSSVTVSFNQNLTAASAGALKVFSRQRGGLRTGTSPSAVSGNTLSFTPRLAFRPGEVVDITVTTLAQGVGGGSLLRPQVQKFVAATRGGTGVFGPVTTTAAAAFANDVTLADIDSDGDLDAVVANVFVRNVSVYFNDGSGRFGTGTFYPLNGGPGTVEAADVDGDGDLDMVTSNGGVNQGGSMASVLLNNGNGVFGAGVDFTVGPNVTAAVLGDVDGDGDLDVVGTTQAMLRGPSAMVVCLNNGMGVFSSSSTCPLGVGALGLSLADVDNDADLDVLAANYNDAFGTRVSVRLNNGQGTFSGGGDYAVNTGPATVAVGDLNGDGYVDLATPNSYAVPGSVSVRFNDGQGRFLPGPNLVAGDNPLDVALADINGDTFLDIVVLNNGGSTAQVWRNSGSGSFGSASTSAMALGAGYFSLGDVDNDGDLDILTANVLNSNMSVALNDGRGAALATLPTGPNETRGLCLFPNPAHGQVKVEVPLIAVSADLLDLLGRRLCTVPAYVGTATLPLSGVAPGSYMVRSAGLMSRLVVE